MKIHPLITKTEELARLVERLSVQPFIAVDTEFMRENTYWPDLCLIQIASTEEAAAIDPKADLDLKPLLELLVGNHEAGPAVPQDVLELLGREPHVERNEHRAGPGHPVVQLEHG